jgi:hypothetical protein
LGARQQDIDIMAEFRADIKAVLDDMLTPVPGVKASRAFGYPAYKINGRIFAFVGDGGIIFKLSPQRAEALRAEPPFTPFRTTPGGKPWTGWVSLDLEDAQEYQAFFDLLMESLTFVGETA